jgi:DNA-directed RNA polymerase subunit H (RpoH/RPB5)
MTSEEAKALLSGLKLKTHQLIIFKTDPGEIHRRTLGDVVRSP